MAWLLDTNVVSEFYKGDRASQAVLRWAAKQPSHDLFLSVLVLGEIRRGVEKRRTKDPVAAASLETWLLDLEHVYRDRILPITAGICDIWGRLSIREQLPAVDALIAATALHHGLSLVTRNTRDFARSGVACLNPFAE
jgi:predicted nucleic acid-binding protein